MPVEFGVGLAPVDNIKRITWLARATELYGYKYFVHADQRFNGERDVFVTLTADALSTEKINLGPCILDPYTRIPGMLATAIASLDEISGHKALLTLGGAELVSSSFTSRETIPILQSERRSL